MAAPYVETLRPGVTFVPDALSSFMRLEVRLLRYADTNSTTRDYWEQMGMYNAWNRYVASGYDPALHPGHSRALHPDYSVHCQGRAWDSDDWRTAGFVSLAEEYGWIRTAAWDPTEQHHFEYQWQRDQHRDEGRPLPLAQYLEQQEILAELAKPKIGENVSTLYRNTDAKSSEPGWAFAGDGVGRAAWISVSDPAVANALAANTLSRVAVPLNAESFDLFRQRYLSSQPVLLDANSVSALISQSNADADEIVAAIRAADDTPPKA